MDDQMEQAKLKLDKYEHDTELAFKYWDSLLQADTEDAKLEQQGESAQNQLDSSERTASADRQNGADRTD